MRCHKTSHLDLEHLMGSSTFGYHASITDLLSIDVRTLPIVLIASSVFVFVALYSLTCWMTMSCESCMCVLNAMLWNISLLFVGLILDLGLEYAFEDSLSYFLLYLGEFRILSTSLKHNFFVGVSRVCDPRSFLSFQESASIVRVSFVHNSPNTSLAPAHTYVIVVAISWFSFQPPYKSGGVLARCV